MRPQFRTTTTLINDANGVFEDQTTAGAAFLDLDGALVSGGVAYTYGSASTDKQGQKLSIEGTGSNSAFTATIVGTDPGGAAQTVVLALVDNGAATTAEYWRSIESIYVNGEIDGNIEGGFLSANGAALAEFYLDRQQLPGNASLTASLSASGAGTFTAQYSVTVRDPQSPDSYAATAVWQAVDGLSGVAATTSSTLAYDAVATRLIITAYTSGTITYTVIQGNPY